MRIFRSETFEKKSKGLFRKNQTLKNKSIAKVEILSVNPDHPSLRLHKLGGKLKDRWSISVDESIRIVFLYLDDGILLLDIGKHEEVY